MRTLYLHIGTPKTGTTAIQIACHDNRKFLLTRGICYPGKEPLHNELVLFSDIHDSKNKESLKALLSSYLEQGKGCDTFLLSTELLYQMPNSTYLSRGQYKKDPIEKNIVDFHAYGEEKGRQISLLKSVLSSYFEKIKIIVYLRRQDNFLESLYLQSAKHNFEHGIDEFHLFDFEMDYYANLKLWADIFGKENLVVFPYDKQTKKDGVNRSFFGLFDIKQSEIEQKTGIQNLTLDIPSYYFKQLLNKSFRDEGLRTGELVNLTEHTFNRYLGLNGKDKIKILSYDRAHELCLRYREGNNRIAQEFLGRDTLFSDDMPEPYETDQVEITIEDVVTISSFLYVFSLSHSITVMYESVERDNALEKRIKALESENLYFRDKVYDLLRATELVQGELSALKERIL